MLLFFSGHGIKDDAGRLYLGTRKTRKTPQGELVRSSAVAANFVHENMSRSRSKRQVVILDSCFSGAFAEGLSAKDDGTVDIRTQLGGEGRAVLTSSSSTQYSFEQEGEELSLYTRFLIEGIRTGEADQDGDDVVSIDELHEYASRKVREVKPELKPEIYAMREGFKIRLSKVPQGDPRERYQKEVARCGKRGELTIVNRSILDAWRTKLKLSVDEAKTLEDAVLEPYRREFQQKLQQYEQVVTDVLRRDVSINDSTRQELLNLQQVLELRNEDTIPIEAQVAAHLKTHNQSLQTYQEAFSEALRQEYPLSAATHSRLQQTRQQLTLSDADVAPIEAHITTEVETYRRNLQQYEQAFVAATQQEYPLSESRRNELRQHQQSLGLTAVEIAPIEATVTTQIETYQQNLHQYEEAFASATQRKHQPNEATRTQLRQTWQTLGLSEGDVKVIEAPILALIETYQANLWRYEQAFADATEQHYPLSQATRFELRQRQQALILSDEDIAPIENRITASVEERLQKLQQYEQVFSASVRFEFPVSEATREELRRFQHVLELGDEEVTQLEEKVTSQIEHSKNQSLQADTSQNASQTTEVDAQEAQNSGALQQYEIEVAKCINLGISLKDYVIRKKLDSLRKTLGLSIYDAEAVELRLNTASPPVQPQYREERVNRSQSEARTPTDPNPSRHETPSPQPEPRQTAESSKASPQSTDQLPNATSERLTTTTQQFLGSVGPTSQTGRLTQHHIWPKWTLAYALGSGVGFALASYLTDNRNTVLNLFAGAIVGLVLGGSQWLLLRHFHRRMRLWMPLTLVSYSTSYAIGYSLFFKLYGSSVPVVLIESLFGLVSGGLVGLAQWYVLKPIVQQSRIWFLSVLTAETLAGAVGWGIILDSIQNSSYKNMNYSLSLLIASSVGGAISGLITGRVMLRLLSLKGVQQPIV